MGTTRIPVDKWRIELFLFNAVSNPKLTDAYYPQGVSEFRSELPNRVSAVQSIWCLSSCKSLLARGSCPGLVLFRWLLWDVPSSCFIRKCATLTGPHPSRYVRTKINITLVQIDIRVSGPFLSTHLNLTHQDGSSNRTERCSCFNYR